MTDEKLQYTESFMKPCKSIGLLSKQTKGSKLDRDFQICKDFEYFMNLVLIFGKEPIYKEITILASYSFQSLIGNAGNF